MHIETGGKLTDTGALTNAKAIFDKDRLTVVFLLPLAKPVDRHDARGASST